MPVLRDAPLFLRIFALVLGAVMFAQVLNFGLVLLVRLSQAQVYTLDEIADTLQGEAGPSSILAASSGTPPAEDSQDQRDLDIRASLSQRLDVDPEALRVNISGPPSLFPDKGQIDSGSHWIDKSAEINAKSHKRYNLIANRFIIALRLSDGSWRIVRPVGSGLAPWQWRSLLWLLGTLIVAAPLAWVMSRRMAAPIHLFSSAAERLGRDPDTPPLAGIEGPPEIASAVATFNDMQSRLKQYVTDRTTMLAAIAHDLRTPLMRLTLLVERLPADIREPLESEIEEMTARIRDAMVFVRDIAGPVRRARLEIRELAGSICDTMADRGQDVQLLSGAPVIVDADRAGLRAALGNLIENATKYGIRARVIVRQTKGHAMVEILDDGPGIPPEELDRVFEPFYRLESSRNRATGGSGLGLASARAVARAHGGDVKLYHRGEGGMRAELSLPIPA